MDITQLKTFQPLTKTNEVKLGTGVTGANGVNRVEVPSTREPQEVFHPSVSALQGRESQQADLAPLPEPPAPLVATTALEQRILDQEVSWKEGGVSFSGQGNGPIVSLEEPLVLSDVQSTSGLSLVDQLKALTASIPKPTGQAMNEREDGYLKVFPHKDDEKSLKARDGLNVRYADPTTSAESMTKTVANFAHERGIEINTAPNNLVGDLSPTNMTDVKRATQSIVDKLFLNKETSFNPEKHATVTEETNRFLELAMSVAPKGFTAGDAYKLVAGNLALISYQDKAAAENMLGDHGVRHLLGHNIKSCEQLADGLEKNGVPVSSMDRLVMHQAMIVHDLGYAMDSVRNPINAEGLKGQDAGHNVLAARYLRERSQNPDDPVAKLFGQGDLERMHRCVLYHDKDVTGGPGVNFQMSANPTDEERATNLETMTRVADNSHAFEDKLPELLYRKPQSLKTLRLMKTAGEVGDKALVETLKGELAEQVKADSSLAKDDREALLQSVSSVNAKSYQFSVGRIAGNKPSFDVDGDGKVHLSVVESDTHQQTVSLFGMEAHKQMEKFVKDCAGEKVTLNGQDETFDGKSVSVRVMGKGPVVAHGSDMFNIGLHTELLGDKPFIKYSLADATLSAQQSIMEIKMQNGQQGLEGKLEKLKDKRRALLGEYRAGQQT